MVDKRKELCYSRLFWLFMAGSVLGVFIEGIFCIFKYGRWETHVVSLWGPFCILYGFGAAGCYWLYYKLMDKSLGVKFLSFCLVGFAVELITGGSILWFLGMRAWDYSGQFLNIQGLVSLKMSIGWGFIGLAFSAFVPSIDKAFSKMNGRTWKYACTVLTVFMALNLSLTAVSIVRWSGRHNEKAAKNQLELMIDSKYDDSFMEKRFCEWRFVD